MILSNCFLTCQSKPTESLIYRFIVPKKVSNLNDRKTYEGSIEVNEIEMEKLLENEIWNWQWNVIRIKSISWCLKFSEEF